MIDAKRELKKKVGELVRMTRLELINAGVSAETLLDQAEIIETDDGLKIKFFAPVVKPKRTSKPRPSQGDDVSDE